MIDGIELAHRPGSGVARIGEDLGACRGLRPVEGGEIVVVHVDLAAHLEDFGEIGCRHLLRHIGDGAHIGGDVFALLAVAARRGLDEATLFVAQRHGKAVDLGFGGEGDGLIGREPEETADARHEVGDVGLIKTVGQRQHGHPVAHF